MNTVEVNTSLTGKEAHSLDGNKVEDVNSAATGLNVPITSEEVARPIRAATDPSTKQLEMLCHLMRRLRRDTVRCDEGTSAPAQDPPGPRGGRNYTQFFTFWLCCQDPTRIPENFWLFLWGSCNIMEDYPGNPGILPENWGIQETYPEIQKSTDNFPKSVGIFQMQSQISWILWGFQELLRISEDCLLKSWNYIFRDFVRFFKMQSQIFQEFSEFFRIIQGVLGLLLEVLNLQFHQFCWIYHDAVPDFPASFRISQGCFLKSWNYNFFDLAGFLTIKSQVF